jgi:hypothetical protein
MGSLVTLWGIDGLDGYNPSNPVRDAGGPVVYVRVEPREVEFTAQSTPFRPDGIDQWTIDPSLPVLHLEDPAVTMVDSRFVLGGISVEQRADGGAVWRQRFLQGRSLQELHEFAEGPDFMKDVRLIEYDDGIIGVFTRPWGPETDRAQIGYTEIARLEDLTAETLAAAPRLETQPIQGQWWGANTLYDLGGGCVGVLGHMARLSPQGRHYHAITFVFDRHRREIVRGPRVIATRSSFPQGPARAPDLEDVVFPSWIDRDRGLLYCGLSDARIGVVPIEDPFV